MEVNKNHRFTLENVFNVKNRGMYSVQSQNSAITQED